MTPVAMEEHYQAYFTWKRRGLRDAWCWHVDAHLDIGKTGLDERRLESLKDCLTSQEAEAKGLLGNSYLPWGGLHCGNYLYPAIREGIVSKLSWVIPPDLPSGDFLTWARIHINDWFDLELAEYQSLQCEEGRITGTLLGIPFEMGTLEALTLPTEPVLLDIDIDYFLLEDGTVWQESSLFAERIKDIPSLCTTVAFSVVGGFTPDSERRLASPFGVDEGQGYEATVLDELAGLVRCQKHKGALELALPTGGVEESIEAQFLKGSSLHALADYEGALAVWLYLLQSPGLKLDGEAYLRGLCSELLLELQRPEEALRQSQLAHKVSPKDYKHYWTEAVAYEKLGDLRKANKSLRKAAQLSADLLFGLKARYALYRIYREQGKSGLANLELEALARHDVTGQYQSITMLRV